MATLSWLFNFLAAFGPTSRYELLFAMSDGELAARGYDRDGLQRTYITGIAGF